MLDSIQNFLPFFCLVGLGWLAVHIQLLTPAGIRAINTFVLFFGLPAMVFLLAARGALAANTVWPMLLVYGLGGTAILLVACAIYARSGMVRQHGGLLALATVFPNTGFLGLPLLTALLGTGAAGPIMATLLVDVLWLSSLGLMWASSTPTGHSDTQGQLKQSLQGALRNPLLWAMAIGLLFNWTTWQLPMAVDKTLSLLGTAASPTALFALGGVLHRQGQPSEQPSVFPNAWVLPAATALKLLLHPASIWCLGYCLHRAGWPLSNDALMVLVMAAALPSASNVLLLAERRMAQPVWVGRLIFWTTLLSMFSMLAWFSALKH
jgi:malonate transporter and related proteins